MVLRKRRTIFFVQKLLVQLELGWLLYSKFFFSRCTFIMCYDFVPLSVYLQMSCHLYMYILFLLCSIIILCNLNKITSCWAFHVRNYTPIKLKKICWKSCESPFSRHRVSISVFAFTYSLCLIRSLSTLIVKIIHK